MKTWNPSGKLAATLLSGCLSSLPGAATAQVLEAPVPEISALPSGVRVLPETTALPGPQNPEPPPRTLVILSRVKTPSGKPCAKLIAVRSSPQEKDRRTELMTVNAGKSGEPEFSLRRVRQQLENALNSGRVTIEATLLMGKEVAEPGSLADLKRMDPAGHVFEQPIRTEVLLSPFRSRSGGLYSRFTIVRYSPGEKDLDATLMMVDLKSVEFDLRKVRLQLENALNSGKTSAEEMLRRARKLRRPGAIAALKVLDPAGKIFSPLDNARQE